MADGNFFTRKSPQERLHEQKKLKSDNVSKSKEKYEKSSRTRGFNAEWKNGRDWLECTSLSSLYPDDVEKVTSALLELKNSRSKSDENYAEEDVKN